MFCYLGDYDSLKYGRKTEINRNHYKHPENRRKINQNSSSSKKRDNSAILRRAINKRYKEDIKEEEIGNNFIKSNNYNNNYNEFDNNAQYENFYENSKYKEYYNYNENNNYNLFEIGNNDSFPERNNFSNYYSGDNFYRKMINYNDYDQALLNRINHNRNRKINSNKRNYYSTNISKDNINDEFIINYNSGINYNDNYNEYSLNRNKTQYLQNNRNNIMNSQIYNNRLSINNNYYQNIFHTSNKNNINAAKSQVYNKYRPQEENYNDLRLVYQKRIINNYAYKDNKENGMSNNPHFSINDQYFLRNNIQKDNLLNKKINRNLCNTFDFNINYDRDYNFINYNISYKDRKKYNNYNCPEFNNILQEKSNINNKTIPRDKRISQDYKTKCQMLLYHFGQYFYLYYIKVVEKLFNFLKSQKNNVKKNKLDISNDKIKEISNKTILYNKNKVLNKTHYLKKYQTLPDKIMRSDEVNKNKEKIERIPYHKYRNILIERIKSNNQSVSPDKKNNTEMYRNIDELNKRQEIISNRKNRLSHNNTKKSLNDLSFNSENKSFIKNSVEKNKEIWENTINKERERRKKLKERKSKQKEKRNLEIKNKDNNKVRDKNEEISELIRKNEELKNKIENIIKEAKSKPLKDKKNMKKRLEIAKNNNFKISSIDRKKIREKYKKKNTNKKVEKYEMIDIKKISTKDKSIFINIKYLNFIPMKNKIKENNKNDFKLYQVCNNFNISFFGAKNYIDNRSKLKNENINNNNIHKLSSIQEENKIDLYELSDSFSHKSDEHK